jgi:cell division septum initiation protein DivIVA
MPEEDPDLLAGDNLDGLRGRNPYSPMSERFRLTELLENARYQNNLLVQKCRELEERIDAIKHEVEAKENINATLTSSFDALRRERDEARWEVCGFHHLTGFLAGDYAISRGWNYFNDERKWAKFPPSVTDFNEFLKAHSDENLKTIERLREENRQLRENRND